MEQSWDLTTQSRVRRSILRRVKVQTLLITLPAAVLAAVGVIVLIPAIAWINDLNRESDTSRYYLWSDYIFISSMVVYFPLHIITAVYGHSIVEMIAAFFCCVVVCSGGASLYQYGTVVRFLYEERESHSLYEPPEVLVHFNLGLAGSFLSVIAVVASLMMMPILNKFRERSSGNSYTHLPAMDNDGHYATGPSVGLEAYPPHAHLPHPAAFSPAPGPMTQLASHYPPPSGAEVSHPAVPPIRPTGVAHSYSGADTQQQGQPSQQLHAFPSAHQPKPVAAN